MLGKYTERFFTFKFSGLLDIDDCANLNYQFSIVSAILKYYGISILRLEQYRTGDEFIRDCFVPVLGKPHVIYSRKPYPDDVEPVPSALRINTEVMPRDYKLAPSNFHFDGGNTLQYDGVIFHGQHLMQMRSLCAYGYIEESDFPDLQTIKLSDNSNMDFIQLKFRYSIWIKIHDDFCQFSREVIMQWIEETCAPEDHSRLSSDLDKSYLEAIKAGPECFLKTPLDTFFDDADKLITTRLIDAYGQLELSCYFYLNIFARYYYHLDCFTTVVNGRLLILNFELLSVDSLIKLRQYFGDENVIDLCYGNYMMEPVMMNVLPIKTNEGQTVLLINRIPTCLYEKLREYCDLVISPDTFIQGFSYYHKPLSDHVVSELQKDGWLIERNVTTDVIPSREIRFDIEEFNKAIMILLEFDNNITQKNFDQLITNSELLYLFLNILTYKDRFEFCAMISNAVIGQLENNKTMDEVRQYLIDHLSDDYPISAKIHCDNLKSEEVVFTMSEYPQGLDFIYKEGGLHCRYVEDPGNSFSHNLHPVPANPKSSIGSYQYRQLPTIFTNSEITLQPSANSCRRPEGYSKDIKVSSFH